VENTQDDDLIRIPDLYAIGDDIREPGYDEFKRTWYVSDVTHVWKK